MGAWPPHDAGIPARVWLFGDNTDYVGKTLETDPLYQIDAHLTRDFTAHLWGSLDAAWYNGGEATVDGVKGEKLTTTASVSRSATRSTTTWGSRSVTNRRPATRRRTTCRWTCS